MWSPTESIGLSNIDPIPVFDTEKLLLQLIADRYKDIKKMKDNLLMKKHSKNKDFIFFLSYE